jgi:GNAT superfamily N-acetyltransferase
MTEVDRLRAWSDENLLASFELLVRHPPTGVPIASRRFGTVTAFAAGRRSGFFNAVAVLAPAPVHDVEAAVGWVRDLGQSVSLRVREDVDDETIRRAAENLGLERSPWVDPAMVMAPLAIAPGVPAGLRIDTATPSTLDHWYAALAASSGVPPTHPFLRDLLPEDAIDDPDMRLYGGFLDDEPVATSVAIRSQNAVGIYAVGTAESARRRGIGSAMTWAAIEAGREWSASAAVLQASAMGEPVYRAMGFGIVAGYVSYDEPRPAQPTSDPG